MDSIFFFISKIVWFIVRPETLLILALWIGLAALLRNKLRLAKWCIGISVTALTVVSILPLGQLVLSPLETRFPANPQVTEVDGIIILGGAENADRSLAWAHPVTNEAGERFLEGIALANKYPEAKVVFTGGTPYLVGNSVSHLNVAEEILKSAGVSQARIIADLESRNTAENATFSLSLVNPDDVGNWILVTSAFHMPRAMSTFCKAGWKNLTAWPTDYRTGTFWLDSGWDLTANLLDLAVGIKEWIGLFAYRITGRSDSLFSSGCGS